MRNEKEGRSKQTARQSNTAHPIKAVTFSKKNELPQVGLEPTTLYTLDRAHMYMYSVCVQYYVTSLPLPSSLLPPPSSLLPPPSSPLQMSSDYDHLTLMQKVEVFEQAIDSTSGDDLAKVLWLKSPSSEVGTLTPSYPLLINPLVSPSY